MRLPWPIVYVLVGLASCVPIVGALAGGCGAEPSASAQSSDRPIVRREVVRHLEFKSGTLIIVNTVHSTGESNTAVTWAPRWPTCNCP